MFYGGDGAHSSVSGRRAVYCSLHIAHLCSLRNSGFAMCAKPLDLEFIESASIVRCTNFSVHCTSCLRSLSVRFRAQRDARGFSRGRRCGFPIFDITRCSSVRFCFTGNGTVKCNAVQCGAVRFSLFQNHRVRCGAVRFFS